MRKTGALDRVKEQKVFSPNPLFCFGVRKLGLLFDVHHLELMGGT